MTSITFYFQVHQPIRLKRLHVFDMPEGFDYWDDAKNAQIFNRVADKCYLPTNKLLREIIERHDGRFRIAFSLSGTFLESAKKFRPDVLESFKDLVKTGHVELLDETYYHSLAGLWEDQTEYVEQIRAHRDAMEREFGVRPTTFRNTELIYDNRIAATIAGLGYKSIMTEGTEKVLDWRSPNYLYEPSMPLDASAVGTLAGGASAGGVSAGGASAGGASAGGAAATGGSSDATDAAMARQVASEARPSVTDRRPPGARQPASDFRVLLKNYRLSDDVAFRFSNGGWSEWPLTAEKYAKWLSQAEGHTINLFMDYETFGEHNWPETGIFEFLRDLPKEVFKYRHLEFDTPSDLVKKYEPVGAIEVPYAISWADTERDVSAWLHNEMQQQCFNDLRDLGPLVKQVNDPELTHAWRLLQTSDHLYYCCTKWMADGDIHTYFSPYDSPYQAFINYMNAVQDVKRKVMARLRG